MSPSIRPPAVAGMFYPDQASRLAGEVESLLRAASAPTARVQPKALIVPHAGYVYSGPAAGAGYARIAEFADQIKRVVLLGPSHRVPVRGLAAPASEAFATPLGSVPIDRAAIESLGDLPQICISDAAHAMEHSLEVQLPFLQRLFTDFSLVPLVVGDADADEVAEVIERLWGGPETLIVISSDLSHYLPYEAARRKDRQTCEAILRLDGQLGHDQACGAYPANGLLEAARKHGLECELVELCNSGDTAGDRNRVVGYAAFAFYPSGRNDA